MAGHAFGHSTMKTRQVISEFNASLVYWASPRIARDYTETLPWRFFFPTKHLVNKCSSVIFAQNISQHVLSINYKIHNFTFPINYMKNSTPISKQHTPLNNIKQCNTHGYNTRKHNCYLSYFLYVLFKKVLSHWRAVHRFVPWVTLDFVFYFAPSRLTVQVMIG